MRNVLFAVAIAAVALLIGGFAGNRVTTLGYVAELTTERQVSNELREQVKAAETRCAQAEIECSEAETKRIECEVQLELLNDENSERVQRAKELVHELSLVFAPDDRFIPDEPDTPEATPVNTTVRRGTLTVPLARFRSICPHSSANCGTCNGRRRPSLIRLISEM